MAKVCTIIVDMQICMKTHFDQHRKVFFLVVLVHIINIIFVYDI